MHKTTVIIVELPRFLCAIILLDINIFVGFQNLLLSCIEEVLPSKSIN